MNRCIVIPACIIGALVTPLAAAPANPHVLFIAVDDLRPQLGCYGQASIKSPNIDRLAARGMVFERAYCQQAICMSSRASLMSGYRPDRGKIYNNGPLFTHVPDALTLNQHFLDHGYETQAMGKINHHPTDYEKGWSIPHFQPKGEWQGRGYLDKSSIAIVRKYAAEHPGKDVDGRGPAWEAPDVADDAYPDGLLANHAVEQLQRIAAIPKTERKPFFLGVGFARPHLPFNAPKKYWDLYDEGQLPQAPLRDAPKDAPKQAMCGWGELRNYVGIPASGPVSPEQERKLIHGYLASVSYVDAMIGRVVAELDRLKLAEDTVIVLWGDHGWKLGDYGEWCKHTNFEFDTRSTLLVCAPGMKAAGGRTTALVEFVDIYPTLCDLAGLAKPKHLEGISFAPLLDQPQLPWKKAAFSQYPRGKLMGRTMRTADYRYTEWRELKDGALVARELYDHRKDDPVERVNLAGQEEHQALVESLAAQLKAGPSAALPAKP